MPAFACTMCGVMENTATSNYFARMRRKEMQLCSQCDPIIGKWHGRFERKTAIGMILASDGFLYSPNEFEDGSLDWRIKHQGLSQVKTLTVEDFMAPET